MAIRYPNNESFVNRNQIIALSTPRKIAKSLDHMSLINNNVVGTNAINK